MVLVPVLVTAGLGNDGDCVDGLHQSPLRQSFCHHLTAKVRQDVPEEEQVQKRGNEPAELCQETTESWEMSESLYETTRLLLLQHATNVQVQLKHCYRLFKPTPAAAGAPARVATHNHRIMKRSVHVTCWERSRPAWREAGLHNRGN